MSNKIHLIEALGRSCPEGSNVLIHENHPWVGWQGDPVHPDAPLGSGGPGGFADNAPLNPAEDEVPQQKAPGPQPPAPDAIELQTQKKPNPPPATQTQSWEMLKVKTAQVDVLINAKVLADGTTDEELDAKTKIHIPPHPGLPGYDSQDGKITKFDKTFVWKGDITIQTVYNTGKPAELSCYGRGTTEEDIKNGDVTLGFHENCHQVDYINYLKNHALPKPPDMKINMSADAYDKAAKKFNDDYDAYVKAVGELWKKTDEVGHKLSTVDSTGLCYEHKVKANP